MIIDSHCHLNMKEFNEDLDLVVNKAYQENIKGMLTISTKIEEVNSIVAIANKYNNIWYSVGIHPHNVNANFKDINETVSSNINNNKFIGIGETGLDYYYENSNKETQKKSFVNHINIARDLDLPIIVHTRNADEDTINILKNEYKRGKFRGLIHCFTASKELAIEVLQLDFFISISGIITFKNANELREIVKLIPIEKLLVETDAPYLAPVPMRGKRNEPSFVSYTASYLAKLLNISNTILYEKTTKNFFNLFNKAKLSK